MSYDNPWRFNGQIVESDDIQDYFGFVYLISCNSNQRKYIGRKYFWAFRTPKGKKRKVKQESDWKNYYGSCPELKEEIKRIGKESFTREIFSLHKTKAECNYEETRQLFVNNVLKETLENHSDIPKYYNSNILSRYYKKDFFKND